MPTDPTKQQLRQVWFRACVLLAVGIGCVTYGTILFRPVLPMIMVSKMEPESFAFRYGSLMWLRAGIWHVFGWPLIIYSGFVIARLWRRNRTP
jgi:hypothetical protein